MNSRKWQPAFLFVISFHLGYDKMCRAEVLIHLRFLLYTFLISFLPILDLVFKTFQFTAFETIPYLYICPLDSVTNGQTSIMVVAGGKVRFQGNKTFPFNENFVLTSQQGKWKIASNTFRYFEWPILRWTIRWKDTHDYELGKRNIIFEVFRELYVTRLTYQIRWRLNVCAFGREKRPTLKKHYLFSKWFCYVEEPPQ